MPRITSHVCRIYAVKHQDGKMLCVIKTLFTDCRCVNISSSSPLHVTPPRICLVYVVPVFMLFLSWVNIFVTHLIFLNWTNADTPINTHVWAKTDTPINTHVCEKIVHWFLIYVQVWKHQPTKPDPCHDCWMISSSLGHTQATCQISFKSHTHLFTFAWS